MEKQRKSMNVVCFNLKIKGFHCTDTCFRMEMYTKRMLCMRNHQNTLVLDAKYVEIDENQ